MSLLTIAIPLGFFVAALVPFGLMMKAGTPERRLLLQGVSTTLMGSSLLAQALSTHERARDTIRSRIETLLPLQSFPGAPDMLAAEVNHAVDGLAPFLSVMSGALLGLGVATVLAANRTKAKLRDSSARVERSRQGASA